MKPFSTHQNRIIGKGQKTFILKKRSPTRSIKRIYLSKQDITTVTKKIGKVFSRLRIKLDKTATMVKVKILIYILSSFQFFFKKVL